MDFHIKTLTAQLLESGPDTFQTVTTQLQKRFEASLGKIWISGKPVKDR